MKNLTFTKYLNENLKEYFGKRLMYELNYFMKSVSGHTPLGSKLHNLNHPIYKIL